MRDFLQTVFRGRCIECGRPWRRKGSSFCPDCYAARIGAPLRTVAHTIHRVPDARMICPECSTPLIVLPSAMFHAVGSQLGPEAELHLSDVATRLTSEHGDRIAIADVDRCYRCPECGEVGHVPPSIGSADTT